MSDRDPERLAERLEREAQELEQRSGELRDRVKGVNEDWQRKRSDQSIPGAPESQGDEDEPQEQDSPGPEARDEERPESRDAHADREDASEPG